MSLTTKNIATAVLGVAMVVSTFAFAAPAQAQSITDLQAMINQLLAQIAALQGGNAPVVGGSCVTFSQNHQMGDTGGQVMDIQKFLNSHGAQVSATGAGSPGNESTYFGAKTRAAIAAWQAANGITPAAGYWGPITRAKANSMCVPGSGGTGGVPVTGNGLKVMLAAGSPNNVALVQGQGIAELARYTFSNPTGSEVTVTSLGFNRIGASTDSAIDNVYLFRDVTRLTDPAGISVSAFNFNDSSGLFKVPAGGSVTISVRADIDSAANGQQVGASLVSVGTTATLDSSVVFPVAGGIQTISAATIASVTWGSVTPNGAAFSPSTDTTVFLSTLTVNNRAVWLKSVQFENRGSTDIADFQNFKLYIKGTQVGGTPMISGDKVIFDVSGTPVRLETGGNEVKLVADIVGGSGEDFDFQIRRGIDINLVDSELNQNLAPSAPGSVTVNTIDGVSLSVVKAASSLTSNVAVAATGAAWGKFEFRASGDDLKVEEVTIDIDNDAGANDSMDNVRVMLDGVQVGSTVDVGSTSSDTTTTISLGSSMVLKAGKTHIVEIYGDAKDAGGTNFTAGSQVDVGVSIDNADTEGMSSGDRLLSDISEVEANTRTVSSSSLTGTKFSGYGNQTMVPGTNNARIGSFTISSGSTEGVNVNTIVVSLAGNNSASITDLRLVDNSNAAQIGSTKTSPSSDNTFSANLALAMSQTKTIDVYANIKSGIPSGTIVATLGASTGGTGASTGQSVTISGAVSLQTITVGSGALTVTRDPGTPVNANVIAGSNMVHVGKFDFDGQNSSFTVEELMVKVPADAATSVANVTLKYKNSAGVEQTVSQALALSSGSQTHATATFTGLTFYVPLNDSADVDVYVDVPTTISGAKSGAAVSVTLDADNGFKAVDGAGTQDTSLASADVSSNSSTGYGTKYVKKSVPVLARLSTGYTANTVATGIGLYRFTVTADAAGSIDWREISLTVTTNSVLLTDLQLYDVTGTATQIGATVASLAASTLSFCPGTSCVIGEAEQIGAGSSKTYEIRSTVTGWGTAGDSVAISFAEDTSAAVNAGAASLHSGQNFVWSDRSAASHTTATTDWTNGYLVKDVDNDTRSCQFGSATTCTP